MKKTLSFILAIVMLASFTLALTSCSDKTTYIGAQAGTTGEFFINGDADWGFNGIAGTKAKAYSTGGLAVNDLKNGVIKYVIIDEQPAKQLVKSIKGVKVIDIPLTEEEYAFGLDKNQPELLASINEILVEIKANGKLDEIIAKYATGEGITPIASAEFDADKLDKQLVVATNAAFAPFEYKEGNLYAGIDMEIIALIAAELDLEVVIMDMEFDAVVTSVGKNGIDIAVSGLTVNDTRKEFVNFSETYYNAAQMLIVAESDTSFDECKTADDVVAKLEELAK